MADKTITYKLDINDAKAVKTADNAIVDYEWCINGKTTY